MSQGAWLSSRCCSALGSSPGRLPARRSRPCRMRRRATRPCPRRPRRDRAADRFTTDPSPGGAGHRRPRTGTVRLRYAASPAASGRGFQGVFRGRVDAHRRPDSEPLIPERAERLLAQRALSHRRLPRTDDRLVEVANQPERQRPGTGEQHDGAQRIDGAAARDLSEHRHPRISSSKSSHTISSISGSDG